MAAPRQLAAHRCPSPPPNPKPHALALVYLPRGEHASIHQRSRARTTHAGPLRGLVISEHLARVFFLFAPGRELGSWRQQRLPLTRITVPSCGKISPHASPSGDEGKDGEEDREREEEREKAGGVVGVGSREWLVRATNMARAFPHRRQVTRRKGGGAREEGRVIFGVTPGRRSVLLCYG